MSDDAAAQATALLMGVRRGGAAIDGLPQKIRPTEPAQSYAIQKVYVAQMIAEYDATVAGYKGGATNPGAMEKLGLDDPFHAVLLSPFVRQSPAAIAKDECNIRVLEVEIAFRMGDNLPAAAFPYDLDAVTSAIATVMPAIEVVDSRYSDWTGAGGLQVIADNGSAGFWVYGAENANWRSFDYEDFPVSLHINGEKIADGNSAIVLESPLNSLTWIANQLCLAGGGLKAGDLVTTGTCTPPTPCNAGAQVMADFGPLGQVQVDFGA
jgi:2-keto-4-pentenoate hydratase